LDLGVVWTQCGYEGGSIIRWEPATPPLPLMMEWNFTTGNLWSAPGPCWPGPRAVVSGQMSGGPPGRGWSRPGVPRSCRTGRCTPRPAPSALPAIPSATCKGGIQMEPPKKYDAQKITKKCGEMREKNLQKNMYPGEKVLENGRQGRQPGFKRYLPPHRCHWLTWGTCGANGQKENQRLPDSLCVCSRQMRKAGQMVRKPPHFLIIRPI